MVNRETSSLREFGKIKNIYNESDANVDSNVDPIDKILDESALGDSDLNNPLEFWKKYEHMFPSLLRNI